MNRFQPNSNPTGRSLVASFGFVSLAIGLFVSLLALMVPATASHAASPQGIGSVGAHPAKPHNDRDNEDGENEDPNDIGSEIREQHGHEGSMQIPPLVIKPRGGSGDGGPGGDDGPAGSGAAGFGHYDVAPVTGGPGDPLGGVPGANAGGSVKFDPEGGTPVGRHPIDLKHVNFSQPTPADVFMQSATVALGAMGIGALILVGLTASRGKLFRRNRPAEAKAVDYNSAD